jgi:hypothetical protein
MNNFLKVLIFVCAFVILSACGNKQKKDAISEKLVIDEDSLLTKVQYQTFQYFWDGAEPNSGLARERIHMDNIYPSNDRNVVTSGGSGFGVMAILVGVERGFIIKLLSALRKS